MKNKTESKEFFKNKFRINSARLQNWDYGWNGSYFITICTKNRKYYFGEIHDGIMYLSEAGKFADQFWYEIPEHFQFIELGEFVVMPNHIHGILIINKNENTETRNVETRHVETWHALSLQIGKARFQNQGKNTISSIIGSYKSAVTKNARKIFPDFGWQTRFHDHIIRDEKSYNRICEYIKNNPANWKDDKFYLPE